MTTRNAIIATVTVFLVGLVISVAVLALLIDPNARDAAERASQLGRGVALLCAIPLGAIWIMWAARVRKNREQKQ